MQTSLVQMLPIWERNKLSRQTSVVDQQLDNSPNEAISLSRIIKEHT